MLQMSAARLILLASAACALSACSSGGSELSRPQKAKPAIKLDKPYVPSVRPGIPQGGTSGTSGMGLAAIMGKDKATLEKLFGKPRLDIIEPVGRKLQFVGKACILDAYLYPDGRGGTEIVTHVDARRSDGAEVDRSMCVDALSKR